jgi:thioredoxin reductase (NADPH)
VHTLVEGLEGERGRLEAVIVRDTVTDERARLPARDLMVFIGGDPSTSWCRTRSPSTRVATS